MFFLVIFSCFSHKLVHKFPATLVFFFYFLFQFYQQGLWSLFVHLGSQFISYSWMFCTEVGSEALCCAINAITEVSKCHRWESTLISLKCCRQAVHWISRWGVITHTHTQKARNKLIIFIKRGRAKHPARSHADLKNMISIFFSNSVTLKMGQGHQNLCEHGSSIEVVIKQNFKDLTSSASAKSVSVCTVQHAVCNVFTCKHVQTLHL